MGWFLADDDGPPRIAVQVVLPRAYGAAGLHLEQLTARRAKSAAARKPKECTENVEGSAAQAAVKMPTSRSA
jgi:hypothetical protein